MIELRKYKCMHVHTQCISRARDLVSVHAYIRPSQSGGRGGRVYEIKIAPEEGGYSRGAYNQASTVHVPCTVHVHTLYYASLMESLLCVRTWLLVYSV